MNNFWKIIGVLGASYLESKQEKVKFKILCSNCENELTIYNSTSLDSGNIKVYKKESYSECDNDEIVVKCQICNNEYSGSINTS